ncbi:MAG: hypothetical protein QXI96_02240, partial [Thermofilum sp.]
RVGRWMYFLSGTPSPKTGPRWKGVNGTSSQRRLLKMSDGAQAKAFWSSEYYQIRMTLRPIRARS